MYLPVTLNNHHSTFKLELQQRSLVNLTQYFCWYMTHVLSVMWGTSGWAILFDSCCVDTYLRYPATITISSPQLTFHFNNIQTPTTIAFPGQSRSKRYMLSVLSEISCWYRAQLVELMYVTLKLLLQVLVFEFKLGSKFSCCLVRPQWVSSSITNCLLKLYTIRYWERPNTPD